jgi:hypothetical protein
MRGTSMTANGLGSHRLRMLHVYLLDNEADDATREAGGGTRTHDLAITNRLLYQLSYSGGTPSLAAFVSATWPPPREEAA